MPPHEMAMLPCIGALRVLRYTLEMIDRNALPPAASFAKERGELLTFHCSGCHKDKTSKNRYVSGHASGPPTVICNGCYGELRA